MPARPSFAIPDLRGPIARPAGRRSATPSLGQAYRPVDGPLLQAPGQYVLGVLQHGVDSDHEGPGPVPVVEVPACRVAMPVLAGAPGREVWFTDQPVHYGQRHGLRYAYRDGLMFGVVSCPAGEPDRAAHDAYLDIVRLTREHGTGPIFRVWNFFPDINGEQAGLERYRRFCLGRYEALSAAGYRLDADLPAASAVGTHGGDLWIAFLAGRGIFAQIENPRQVSAFRYPPAYGPRSPSFSRAIRFTTPRQDRLFISGTASILGHRSHGTGDPALQCRTTADNLQALLAAAGADRLDRLGERARWKIYLRHPRQLEPIREQLSTLLDPASPCLYVAGDICRADLLLEIEGVVDL